MSTQWTPPPGWAPQPEPAATGPTGKNKARIIVPAATGLGGLLLGLIIGVPVGAAGNEATTTAGDNPFARTAPATPAAQPQPAAEEPAAEPPAPAKVTPAVSDFTVKLTVLSKQCFGSAGCNITYRVDPKYSGLTLNADDAWRVTYSVTGGDSGPVVNSFTLRGTQAELPSEEMVSTSSSKVKLAAKVTQVLEE